MIEFKGIVLAGGKSLRMGEDKALLSFHGRKLIEYNIELLKNFCDNIIISGNSSLHSSFGYKVVEDIYEKIGPIGGLHAALSQSDNVHHLVCPCDMPFLTTEIFNKVIRNIEEQYAVAVAEPGNKVVPLVGYYNRTAQAAIEEQIKKGDYKMQNLLQALNARIVQIDDEKALSNINSPSDLI